MKKTLTMAIVIFITILACSTFAQNNITPEMKKDLMPVSQLSRGMKGYGLTVFQGTKIEKFNFEIRGILKDANSDGDLILVKISNPLIDSRKTGVIQGMSGSPCYINGKLIGAVAYGSSFSKENTCMLTPIYDMLETLDPKLITTNPSLSIKPKTEKNKVVSKNNSTESMQKLLIPLSMSGVSSKTKDFFSGKLTEMGFAPVSGGKVDTASQPDAKNATLKPGAAVGAVMVSGDIVMTGTGTVTYRKGNQILAFGHPMDGIGQTDIPMCTAYVVDIFSGYSISYKYSNPINIVGQIYQDRPYAIAGKINGVANMTPIKVKVSDRSTGRQKTLNCKVASNPYYFNSLAPLPVIEAYMRVRPQITQTNAKVTYDIELQSGKKHTFTNYYTSEDDITMQIYTQLMDMMDKLNGSKYGFQKIKSLNVNIDVDNGNKYAYIERVFIEKNIFKAGETVELGLVMRPYASKETFTEYKKIKIPDNIEDGNVTVLIYGGTLADMVRLMPTMKQGGNVIDLFQDMDNSTSFEQYFSKYLEFEKNNELIVKLVPISGDVLVVEGNKLENMPPYMNTLFTNSNNSVISSEKLEFKNVFPTNKYIPMGIANISLPIKNDINISVRGGNAKPLSAQGYYIEKNYDNYLFNIKNGNIKLAGELEEALDVISKEVKDKNVPSELKEIPDEIAKADSEKKPAEAAKKDDQKTVTTISKKPLTLEIKESEDIKKGSFVNCNIGKDDIIYPTISILSGTKVPEQMTTTTLEVKDTTIIGTGLKAGIYKLDNNSKVKKICSLEGLWVSSLIETQTGEIYASVSPDGKVYKIDLGTGTATLVKTFANKYISDMIVTNDNKILVGFADSNKIFIMDNNFNEIKSLTHDGIYTTDFAINGKGKIVAGTKRQVLEIKNDNISILANDIGGSINCVAVTDNDDVYAFVATKNIVVKINKDGINKIAEKCSDMFRAISDKTGNVYFAGKNNILRIFPDNKYVIDDCKNYTVQFSNIMLKANGNALLSSVNPGSVYEISLHPDQSIYGTNLIDFGTDVQIANIDVPIINCAITAGESAETAKNIDSGTILKTAKFFIAFSEKSQGNLSNIKINYFMPNRAPEVKITNINPNMLISGKKTIEWEINDPDKDSYKVNLSYKKSNSNDEWTIIYPNKDKQVKKDDKTAVSFELDSKTIPYGIYDFKLTADDILSNPKDAKQGNTIINQVKICNDIPTLTIDNEPKTAAANSNINLNGKADSSIGISGVQYSIDNGEWTSAIPESNIFTGIEAKFTIVLTPLPAGEHTIIIRAISTTGNYSDKEIKFKVE